MQAPGCEQQAGKAVWSTMHSSPRHSRPLAYKSVYHYDHVDNNISKGDLGNHKSGSAENIMMITRRGRMALLMMMMRRTATTTVITMG